MGTADKTATCAAHGTDNKKLVCTYIVSSGNEDTDGISIDANSLSVPTGAAIRVSGTTTDFTLTHDAVARRICDLALQGHSVLDIVKTLNSEGIPNFNGKRWLKTTIHAMLTNEAYTGSLVWGQNARDGAPPVRVEDAFPAIVTRQEFVRIGRMMQSRAPKQVHPRRAVSPYLLSGLLKCETCRKAMTAAEAKGGKYTYYICHSC